MSARRTEPTTAAEAICLGPARAARIPPVTPPDMMEFHGSSCFDYCGESECVVSVHFQFGYMHNNNIIY